LYSKNQIIEDNQKREVNLEIKLNEEETKSEELPAQILYDVPFTPQAPFGNWDDIRQDTGCEEASIFMAMKWVNEEDLTFEEAEQEIIATSEFEEENYGHHHDTSSQDTIRLIKDYYGYDKVYLEYDIGVEEIKTALAQGNLVIVPINGQIVGNPYYTLPGPFQHKMVIRGYDDTTQEFITNDPGTKRGEGYRYDYQVLENALMDYPTGFNEPVEQIIPAMIVVKRESLYNFVYNYIYLLDNYFYIE
jgi:hypothetical protein